MPFATLDSLKKKGGGDDDDEKKRNEYYAGGAGNRGGSGLNVVGPGEDDDIKQRILERAKQESKDGANALRDDEEFVLLTIYANGFTIDNGPLRESGVAANDVFMQYISEGRCPPELIQNGQPANVKLEDKTSEDYTPPPYVAFSGGGMQLSGGSTKKSEGAIIQPVSGADLPEVDQAKDTIRVKIGYPDRTKTVVKFNKHHTVHDLISVIHHSGKVDVPFVLLGPPPSKPIESTEFTKTITDAGLANTAVTVSTKI